MFEESHRLEEIREGMKKIVKNSLAAGLSNELIAQIMSLNATEIESLCVEIENEKIMRKNKNE
jgi:hypothetical protein